MMRKKVIEGSLHLLGWIGFFLIPLYFRPPFLQQFSVLLPWILLLNLQLIGLFYLNYFCVAPLLLNRQKRLHYVVLSLLLILGFVLFGDFIRRQWLPQPLPGTNRIFNVFPALFILAISTAIRLFQNDSRREKVMKEMENENLRTQLSFLRSQISPHFVFNVLNGVVALSRLHPERVEPVMIRLSQLMRYMLYESAAGKVPLEKEWEYLQNYIELQMMRFGPSVDLQPSVRGDTLEIEIEPMLLIPFVENAFKYGISLVKSPVIRLDLSVSQEELWFRVENKVGVPPPGVEEKAGGLGLENVRRRLELLYPGRHDLRVEREQRDGVEWFVVTLNLIF